MESVVLCQKASVTQKRKVAQILRIEEGFFFLSRRVCVYCTIITTENTVDSAQDDMWITDGLNDQWTTRLDLPIDQVKEWLD